MAPVGAVIKRVLVVTHLPTAGFDIAASHPIPQPPSCQQCARQLTDPFEGFLLGNAI